SAAQIGAEVAAAAAHADKTVVATEVGATDRSLAMPGTGHSLPVFAYPEAAAAAVAMACRCAETRDRPPRSDDAPPAERRRARSLVRRALADGRQWLSPDEVATLLDCYHVPQVAQRTVSAGELADPRADVAARAAAELGYPLAVKISGAGIVHKSDAGGVQLDVRDERQ